ncbi:hypothetical protein UFOVP395_89 [uncultured Caudovirales phage]|uniref:Uncharacterized protein n=1 Tax=uncultured Caudovirales phage TaxID=2100421 RepID=A0A6J5M1W9_9CAUD|nr:hypothetical protein UFOVP395_89 [uncultured Caudovirales phage]
MSGLFSRFPALGRTAAGVGRVSTGVAAAQTLAVAGIVGTGGYLAIGSATDLYRSRGAQASQFQSQLQFPEDLVQTERDFFIAFSFMKYEKRSIQDSPFLRSEGTVRLPLPDALRDNLSVSYNSPALGPAVGAALDAVAGAPIAGADITGTISNLTSASVNALAQGITGGVGNVLNTTGAAGQAAQAYLGLAVNPYQTVLFEKPEFKTHNFSWKIMPKNERESEIARNIFRTFQFHASPGISQGAGVFFSYPSMVVVSLYPRSEFLYRFKPCVLRSVNINYAAGSNPSFFKRTDAPTAMTISLQLQEIEYWTSNDYSAEAFSDTDARINAIRLSERQRNAGSS